MILANHGSPCMATARQSLGSWQRVLVLQVWTRPPSVRTVLHLRTVDLVSAVKRLGVLRAAYPNITLIEVIGSEIRFLNIRQSRLDVSK